MRNRHSVVNRSFRCRQEHLPGIIADNAILCKIPITLETLDSFFGLIAEVTVCSPFAKVISTGDQKSLQKNDKNEVLWQKAVAAVHDIYLGKCPEKFTYNGKEYTPKSFYESLGLNPDDYISITSYTHHPFYEKFVLEIQDNWRWAQCYNVPLDEMMDIFDYAIDNGYTVAWGSDVSEQGFRMGVKKGFCVLPETKPSAMQGSDMAHWTGMSAKEPRLP